MDSLNPSNSVSMTKILYRLLKKTHTPDTPWYIIRSDDKPKARLETIKLILGLGDSLRGQILAFDSLEMPFREFKLRTDPDNEVTHANRNRIEVVELDDLCAPTLA